MFWYLYVFAQSTMSDQWRIQEQENSLKKNHCGLRVPNTLSLTSICPKVSDEPLPSPLNSHYSTISAYRLAISSLYKLLLSSSVDLQPVYLPRPASLTQTFLGIATMSPIKKPAPKRKTPTGADGVSKAVSLS